MSREEKMAREHGEDRNGTTSQRAPIMDREDKEVGLVNYWQ